MATVVLQGPTIAAGASMSSILNVQSGGIYRVIMPPLWTGAVITFCISYNGTDFYDAYDRGGNEIVMRCIPMSMIPIGEYLFYIHSVKIRSGTHSEPVIQKEQRMFQVVLDNKQTMLMDAQTHVPQRVK